MEWTPKVSLHLMFEILKNTLTDAGKTLQQYSPHILKKQAYKDQTICDEHGNVPVKTVKFSANPCIPFRFTAASSLKYISETLHLTERSCIRISACYVTYERLKCQNLSFNTTTTNVKRSLHMK